MAIKCAVSIRASGLLAALTCAAGPALAQLTTAGHLADRDGISAEALKREEARQDAIRSRYSGINTCPRVRHGNRR
jgi:hypothetical protein